MPLSDSDSDSDVSSSFGGDYDDDLYAVTKKAPPAANKRSCSVSTAPAESSDSFSSSDDDSSDDDSSEDEAPRRRAPRRAKSCDGLDSNSEVARMRKLMDAIDAERSCNKGRKKPTRTKSMDGNNFRSLVTSDDKRAADEALRKSMQRASAAKTELDTSSHHLAKMNEQLEKDALLLQKSMEDMEKELGVIETKTKEVDPLKDIKKKKKKKNAEAAKSEAVNNLKIAQQKREFAREQRLARVRERLQKEEDEKLRKEMEERNKKPVVDNSEDARRDRIYEWYMRAGFPSKDDFFDRIAALPTSSGVTTEDIDLLTWNARGTRARKALKL